MKMATEEELETQARELSGGAPSSASSSPEADGPKLWEKPGFAGKARRAHRAVQRYLWDDPDKPAQDKWFLFKLDFFLLSSACLGYFSKNLDQANINNAFVSGVSLRSGDVLVEVFANKVLDAREAGHVRKRAHVR